MKKLTLTILAITTSLISLGQIHETGSRVGVGTTNPQAFLDVRGSILLPSDGKIYMGTLDGNSGELKIHNSSCCYNNYFDSKGGMYFRTEPIDGTNGTQAAMGIQADGSVVIGTWPKYSDDFIDTDGYKLLVNGGITCEEVKVVKNVPTSDFVFEKDYDLRSLDEVKEFVTKNKHLPEIPSAADFQKNGYSVGTMDDLLLRKVEELTLYMIDLKEKVEALEAENKVLKATTAR